MSEAIRSIFKWHFEHPRYGWYVALIGLMLIVAPMNGLFHMGRHLVELVYGAFLIVGPFFVATSYRRWWQLTLLGLINLIIFIAEIDDGIFTILGPISTIIFFAVTFWEIMKYILREKEITQNTILATTAGYTLLAIAAGPLFYLLETTSPGAFRLPEETQFFDFIYFSFMTVTTVGFGDIVPVHPMAKSIAIILSVAGQLYLTVIMGLIIGQYLGKE